MGFAHVVLNSYTFFLIISTISSSYKSHTSPLTPPSIYPATKPSRKTVYDEERNHQLNGKPRRRCTDTCQKRLSYTSLSTQSLSSLDPSSDYLAIAVKIKGAAPIHLFNVYVPPIRSSSSDSRPKSFSPFLLPSSPTTYIFGDFNSHHSSWDSHSPEDHSGKDLFDWLLSSDLLPLNNPEHHTLLHRATGNRSSPNLSLVPARTASKCTWQTLPDLGSDHLPISITIPTSPIINSFHRPPSFNYNKARMITLLILIPTALLPLTLQHSLFLKPPTPLPNSSMMLPPLPFLSAASTALLKPGGLLKLQMPSQNAERHLQRHTVPKKTASTISLLPYIPPL